jgi:hypothetical protein
LDKKQQVFSSAPSKILDGGRRIDFSCDLFMLHLTEIKKGILVSNNNFLNVLKQGERFKQIIEDRILMYLFMEDE